LYPVSQSQIKVGYFYFYDNFSKNEPVFIIFFTVKFRKDLQRKLELKLPPPLKSVAALPRNTCSTIQFLIHISENKMLHVG